MINDKLILLVSGNLGFEILKNLFSKKEFQLTAVFTDSKSISIIDFCRENNINLFKGNPRGGRASTFVANLSCDLLLSVNYLFIIEQEIIKLATKYAINVHGSLLPKYRGRTPHVWAIINGENETGVTAHLIDEQVDNGDILKQIKIPINGNETGADILNKFVQLYPKLIDEILSDYKNDSIKLISQDKNRITYFGKRNAEDGKINWNWSKERIKNWVRAQSKPYPGAFSFYNNQKIIVHKIEFDDKGYSYEMPNGIILDVQNNFPIIKTPNGAIRLIEIETDININFQIGNLVT